VVQLRDQSGFLFETVGEFGFGKLEGDDAAQAGIAGFFLVGNSVV